MKTRSLSAVTTATIGLAFSYNQPRQDIAMQVHCTGEPTAGEVILEGTIDGTNYFRLGSFVGGSDANDVPITSNGIPVRGVRAQCILAPSGGTSPTFSADITAM